MKNHISENLKYLKNFIKKTYGQNYYNKTLVTIYTYGPDVWSWPHIIAVSVPTRCQPLALITRTNLCPHKNCNFLIKFTKNINIYNTNKYDLVNYVAYFII